MVNDSNYDISILYVEDDATTTKMVKTVIANKFPTALIYHADNGKAGLELYRKHVPDIVLTDISMPIMSGIEMARQIRALNPSANIIATTALNDTQCLLDAIQIGISRYLLKPFDLPVLFEAIQDSIARVTLQRQLKEQNALISKLSRAIEQSPSMVVIANVKGEIEYVNPKFTEVTGYAPDEVMQQNLRVFMPSSLPVDSLEMVWSTITRGSEWRGEFMNRTKNGELYYENLCISPLALEDGKITHLVAVMEDVSERKQAEERIRRLNEELERRVQERTVELEASNRELEAFCYSVAHDLTAPLRGMSGFGTILMQDYSEALDETGIGYLRRITAGAERMGQLINDLLNLSRVTRWKLDRQQIELSSMVADIADTLREQEPERQVEICIAEGIEAECDPTLARQALENLIGNAWKYTSREPAAKIEFGSCLLKGFTFYYVRDNGIGFDMEYAAKIFRPFERLHLPGEFEGTGVGLATVQRIITRHGGQLLAEGKEGKGATFYFTFG